jgi:DNA-binding PadR family transcriptional regulator
MPQDLTPAAFNILLCLAGGTMHGYAIIQSIKTSTEGRVKLGPGTLYTTIKKLLETGLVAESEIRPDDDDERRRYYMLTPTGRKVVQAEAQHLERLVKHARSVKLLKGAA